MKWKTVKKGNKWVKRPQFDVDDWITLVILVLVLNYIMIRLIIKGA
jgi:hypothetical protein